MTFAQQAAATQPNRRQRRQAERQARKRNGKTAGGIQGALARAKTHHVAGRLDEAEAIYRETLAGGEDPQARALLGTLCLQHGRAGEAIQHLEKAQPALRDEVSLHTNLGLAYDTVGQLQDADRVFEHARSLRPEDPENRKNIANWLFHRRRYDEAIPLLTGALKAAPKDAPRWSLLAQCHGFLNQLEPTIECARKACELEPENPRFNAYLGLVLTGCGRFQEALDPMIRGFPAMSDAQDYHANFMNVLSCVVYDRYRPEMEQPLLTCFEKGLIDVQRLSTIAGAHIWLRYMASARQEPTADGKATKVHFDGILGDPLLIHLLGRTVNKYIGLETLLVPLRRSLLADLVQRSELSVEAMRFVVAFAMQCHHNSYVFPVTQPEIDVVDRICRRIEARLTSAVTPDSRLELDLALSAMYRPLHGLEGFERLTKVAPEAWSETLRPFIQIALLNPIEEQELKATIPAFGSIEDEVSQAVRSQYEENPYPRWTFLPEVKPLSFEAQHRIGTPWVQLPGDFEEPQECLIAGCGTGRHPINIAVLMPHARFLAIDLSLSSLAYAKRMARQHGVENIEFMHGDILEIDALGRDFPWIESCGVLHHMESPERGLEKLLTILRPGGFLRLGLYSRKARRYIIEARERIQAMVLEPTADNIREFRRRVVSGEEPNLNQLAKLGDFFDLDSFRDLVFHVQEHQFTIPDLKGLLERHNLEFHGFIGLKPTLYLRFKERFPDSACCTDMDCWAEFEEENPDGFLGMYEFWARSRT